mmetsp:Transcript_5930/g.6527  ORF Transcript_5930/g.6527 Transcript_5930/m.6527 type:complete len:201 (+) Transcript_5930:44-646(+)
MKMTTNIINRSCIFDQSTQISTVDLETVEGVARIALRGFVTEGFSKSVRTGIYRSLSIGSSKDEESIETWRSISTPSELPAGSFGKAQATTPPTIEQALVTKSKRGMFFSKVPLTNCPATAPNRPLAASRPMAEDRATVGKTSEERQSKEFHPITPKALNKEANNTTTTVFFVSKANPMALIPAKHMPPDSNHLRPKLSM